VSVVPIGGQTTGPVAVVGAYGGAGEAAVRQLDQWGIGPLRLGGRDGGRAAALAKSLTVPATGAAVDAADPADLDRFCAGAAVVLNCAGPAYRIGDRVAAAAGRAGTGYVDAAGDDAFRSALAGAGWPRPAGWPAVISAGVQPGLTGLLPRYAAAGLPGPVTRLLAYVGGRDRFTHAAAADYVAAGAEFGEPLAAWRHGVRVPRALAPLVGVPLPFFPEPVTAQPYVSGETERVARDLGLDEVDWYSVFTGQHVLAALRQPDADRDRMAERLRRAADLDLFGGSAYQLLVLELTGSTTRTVVLRGTGASALTGAVAAVATRAVLAGAVPPGVHHAAEVLDPVASVALLAAGPAIVDLATHERPVTAAEEEGYL
jgi:hypothetical protein